MSRRHIQVDKAAATRRLMRDLREWENTNIPSIGACPLESNIFEWHANVRPTDGVYSSVCVHLQITFPPNYPHSPPAIRPLCAIRHPNVFDSYICLSMLREETTGVPYEGWSSCYTVTSILMQLQTFLFAEKIGQDGGYSAEAQMHDRDVKSSIDTCRKFVCRTCGHNHSKPWPPVYDPSVYLVTVKPMHREVFVKGSAAQTTATRWVGAYGDLGVKHGRVVYEVYVNWSGDKWARNNIRGGLCRFGWGTEQANECGKDAYSFGYGGTGMYSYNNDFTKFGESFGKGDTITCGLDIFERKIWFGKNGRLIDDFVDLPAFLVGWPLYPILSFKNSRAEFNFGEPKKPVPELRDFLTLEAVYRANFEPKQEELKEKDVDGDVSMTAPSAGKKKRKRRRKGGSNSQTAQEMKVDFEELKLKMIDDVWVMIFENLNVPGIYRCNNVCREWRRIINAFNVYERNSVCCFHTKISLNSYDIPLESKHPTVLGVGFSVSRDARTGRISCRSQMDLLSLHAWENEQVRIGVWGEKLTHFLPMIINKEHGQRVMKYGHLRARLYALFHGSDFAAKVKINKPGAIAGGFATVMNSLVVDFVMTQKKDKTYEYTGYNAGEAQASIPMTMCDKIVNGYIKLYHLLLYLMYFQPDIIAYANKEVESFIRDPVYRQKSHTPDLGKFLILVLISKYSWKHVGKAFMNEVCIRNALWITRKSRHLNTTRSVRDRGRASLEATEISRRLVMFQVWFMDNFTPRLRGPPQSAHASASNSTSTSTAMEEETKQRNKSKKKGSYASASTSNKKDPYRNVVLQELNGYHRRLGCATLPLRQKLQEISKLILGQGSEGWNEYFTFCGFKRLSSEQIDDFHAWCVGASSKAGYHRCPDDRTRAKYVELKFSKDGTVGTIPRDESRELSRDTERPSFLSGFKSSARTSGTSFAQRATQSYQNTQAAYQQTVQQSQHMQQRLERPYQANANSYASSERSRDWRNDRRDGNRTGGDRRDRDRDRRDRDRDRDGDWNMGRESRDRNRDRYNGRDRRSDRYDRRDRSNRYYRSDRY